VSGISRDDIRHVALLSRLELDDEYLEKMTSQLNAILGYIAKLEELDTSGVEPMSHPGALQNVFREDEPGPSLDREDALSNAPSQLDGFYKVPKVIE